MRLAPLQLGERGLGPEVAPGLQLCQHVQAVQAQALQLHDPAGQPLAQQRVLRGGAGAARHLVREGDDVVQLAAEAGVLPHGRRAALEAEQRHGDRPAVVHGSEDVVLGHGRRRSGTPRRTPRRPSSGAGGGPRTPSACMSTSSMEMPRCLEPASGVVRTRANIRSACSAFVVHTFWPFTTQWSPASVARVDRAARSEPAPGSEKPWHQMTSLCRRGRDDVAALLVGAVDHHRRREEGEAQGVDGLGRPGARHLLLVQALLHQRAAAPAVLRRPVHPGEPGGGLLGLPAPTQREGLVVVQGRPEAGVPPRRRDGALEVLAQLEAEPLVGLAVRPGPPLLPSSPGGGDVTRG